MITKSDRYDEDSIIEVLWPYGKITWSYAGSDILYI